MNRALSTLLLACALAGSAPASAETPEELAFGFGQFTGAATFCKMPKDQVSQLADTMLTGSGIDTGGPSPAMTRFKEGVADGVRSMSAPDAATCAEVKSAFDEAYAKLK
jgi:hypothetical protein